MMSRRALLAGAAGVLASRVAKADVDPGWRPRDLDVREIRVDGAQSRLFVLATPRGLEADQRVPLVVLLHGLGETGDEHAGAWAWLERYGLGSSYDRLRAASSMRGLAFACPYMPDLAVADPRAFDAYATWLVETVVPRARAEGPVLPGYTYLGGCSLGGHFSLETLLRRPGDFRAWAGVQTAIGAAAGRTYAARLASLSGSRDLLVETSGGDPFRAGNRALSAGLEQAGVARSFVELPGPHDQVWLRTSGTAAMIQWFDSLPRPERRQDPPDRRAAGPEASNVLALRPASP
jgi:poly(3-hydroxybutyrate) depolymerase